MSDQLPVWPYTPGPTEGRVEYGIGEIGGRRVHVDSFTPFQAQSWDFSPVTEGVCPHCRNHRLDRDLLLDVRDGWGFCRHLHLAFRAHGDTVDQAWVLDSWMRQAEAEIRLRAFEEAARMRRLAEET